MTVSESTGNRKPFLGKENMASQVPCWEIQLGLALRTWQAGSDPVWFPLSHSNPGPNLWRIPLCPQKQWSHTGIWIALPELHPPPRTQVHPPPQDL